MFSGCTKLEYLNIISFVFNKQENYYSMFDGDEILFLIVSADFYNHIIDDNEFLKIIDENVTIIG